MGSGPRLYNVATFYMIQLIPDIRPQRIKFGVAIDLDKRLLSHRCTCPQARVYASWPDVLLSHEQKLIAYVVERRPKSKKIGFEVVDVDDLEGAKDCIDEWLEINLKLRRSADVPLNDPTAMEALDTLMPDPAPRVSRRSIRNAELHDIWEGRQLPSDLTVL